MIKNLPLSFEFFPPKTADGLEQLAVQHALLAPYQPRFFSITYGAGGDNPRSHPSTRPAIPQQSWYFRRPSPFLHR